MDRQERTPVLEPLLLMLKQRTGIAVILSFIVGFLGYYFGLPHDITMAAMAVIGVYVGGQKIVDSRESASKVQGQVDKIIDALEDTQ